MVTGGFFDQPVGFQNTGQGYWKEGDIASTVRTPEGSDSLKSTVVAYGFSGESDGSTVRNASDMARTITNRHGDPGFVAYHTNAARQVDLQGDLSAALTSNTDPCTQILDFRAGNSAKARSMGLTEDCSPTLPSSDSGTNLAPTIAMINMQGSKGNSVAQEDGPSFTLNAMHGHDVHAVAYRVHEENSTAMTGNGSANIADPVDVSRSLDTCGGYATNQGGNVVKHSMQVRRLTPVECERLQGIPDNFTKIAEKSADGPRYKMIGNGFAVPCVAWIGKRIQMVEDMK